MPVVPGFVGRASELSELVELLHRAAAGGGGVALVVGEPGIGKTALVEQVVGVLDLPVLWARARPGAPPLWLWDQVLRAARRAELITGSATPSDSATDVGLVGAGYDRFRRFDEIGAALTDAAARRPFVIVLDDLHWADPDSRDLLDFLTPALADTPLAVIVTARDTEIETLPPAHLTLELKGLPARDLGMLISNRTGTRPSADVVTEVERYTGGNPFFVGEVARLLRSSGHADEPASWSGVLPHGVRSVLARRFARLPQASAAAVTSAAVLGSEFDATLLAAVLEVDREDLYDQLEPAARAGLLEDRGDGRFRFAHDLVRDAAVTELDSGRRRRVHERAAVVLEATHGLRAAPMIALHRSGCGDSAGAAEWAEHAGDNAFREAMYAEAVDWYAKAAAHRTHLALAVKVADALARSGLTERAKDAYLRAVREARERSDAEAFAAAALGVGSLGGGFEVRVLDIEQLALLREALEGLGDGDSALRSLLLARLSVALTLGAAQSERVALADRSVAMARRIGDDSALAYALSAWCDAHAGPGSTAARQAVSTEMLSAAQRTGDPELALLAWRFQIVAHLEMGDVAQAFAAIDAFAALADRLRLPQFCWYARLVEGMRAHLCGSLDEAFRLATAASELGRSVSSANAEMLTDGALLPVIARDRGQPGFAEAIAAVSRRYPEAARGLDLAPLFSVGFGEEDPEQVRRALAFASKVPIDSDDALFLFAMATVGNSAALVRDAVMMDQAEAALLPYAGHFVLDGTAAVCYGPVATTLARIAAARGDAETARTRYAQAHSLLRIAGAPIMLGRVEAELTELGHPTAPDARTGLEAIMRREGDVWYLAFDGSSSRLRHSKGMSDLAVLLPRPGMQYHVFDLVSAAEGHDRAATAADSADLGDVIDGTARAAYRQRIRELSEEIEEAEAHHDHARAARLDEERAALVDHLAAALGLSGRARRQGGDAERARKAVSMRLRDTISRIERELPSLGRHLRRSVLTGMFCCYAPERPIRWHEGKPIIVTEFGADPALNHRQGDPQP